MLSIMYIENIHFIPTSAQINRKTYPVYQVSEILRGDHSSKQMLDPCVFYVYIQLATVQQPYRWQQIGHEDSDTNL